MIGKIHRIDLREVWKHEATDFTTWLRDNIEVLNEALDINLSGVEREQSAGSFSVDLVAEDDDGNTVIIENQLEKSDHDHLGKVVTYLSALEAAAAVWIVSNPRPEHVGAIAWLNESTSASFYLLKVEAIRIGDSLPAPLLTLIVGPSKETKQIGEIKGEMAERYKMRYRFWTELLDKAKERTKLHSSISPNRDYWISTGAGKSGLWLSYIIRQHDADVALYIDRGKEAEGENKDIFDELIRSRGAIDSAFGEQLEWERLEGKRACRIRKRLELGGYRDEEKWPEIHEAMIDAMVRLEKALRPHVDGLRI